MALFFRKGIMTKLNGIKNGDWIQITLANGVKQELQVHIGDAALKGNSDAIWLKTDNNGHSVYLRKLPQKPLSIGVALFDSKSELENTLNSGQYYIA